MVARDAERELIVTDLIKGDDAGLASADLGDALRELEAAEKKSNRHLVWALMGLSPAALIPFAGLLIEGSLGLIVVLITLVFFIEGWRYLLTSKEVSRLRAVVAGLESGHREPLTPLDDGSDDRTER